jgi:hypothetical protein
VGLISGYRTPRKDDDLHSYHNVGRGADLRLANISDRDLFEYCRSLGAHQGLGCGFYPRGQHVHVDVRSKSTIWVDLSGYGDGANYVPDPSRWLRDHPSILSKASRARY